MPAYRPKVKICGITRLEDARLCAALGADYLGFIQYPESPRYIEPGTAREIIAWLYGPEPVGVFVNTPPETINAISDEAGFALVQLHGDYTPDDCAAIERPVIRAIQVRHDASVEHLRAVMAPFQEVADFFLLDTYHTDLWGGTGEAFNWRVARELSAEYPIFLAGGIRADNVEEAVATMRPYALDLSSGVEEAPGIKDPEKLEAFFETLQSVTRTEDD